MSLKNLVISPGIDPGCVTIYIYISLHHRDRYIYIYIYSVGCRSVKYFCEYGELVE